LEIQAGGAGRIARLGDEARRGMMNHPVSIGQFVLSDVKFHSLLGLLAPFQVFKQHRERFLPSRLQEIDMAATKTAPASRKSEPRTGSKTARKTARSAGRPADAIKLLKDDHREVKGYFKQYESLEDEAEKQALADRICLALTVHAQIEEEIYYPATREAIDDDDLLDEAEVEHASAKQLIAEIQAMKVGDRLFDAKVTVLGEYVDHHVEEEEKEMFPESRDSDLDLKALGVQLAERKAELMGQAS
jgi:hemerythrin superfamily protein